MAGGFDQGLRAVASPVALQEIGVALSWLMEIDTVRHKGLRRFIEAGDASGLPASTIEKIRNIVSFLQSAASADEVASIPSWKAHRLTGDRKATWALHVTANWRITFRLSEDRTRITDLDFEDYH